MAMSISSKMSKSQENLGTIIEMRWRRFPKGLVSAPVIFSNAA